MCWRSFRRCHRALSAWSLRDIASLVEGTAGAWASGPPDARDGRAAIRASMMTTRLNANYESSTAAKRTVGVLSSCTCRVCCFGLPLYNAFTREAPAVRLGLLPSPPAQCPLLAHSRGNKQTKRSGSFLRPPQFFPRAASLLEKLHRIDQRLQYSKRQGDAHKSPREGKLQRRGTFLISIWHVRPPYARAPAGAIPGSLLRASLASMWKRASTALTRKLQMKPITNRPAMMYIVVL
jgi:hypothetical protein